ncbi:MAG: 30S ribosomal protein S24e [Methanomassiliicoccales archaeon]
MKIEIIEKKENVLQQRLEVRFKIDHTGEPTPSRDAIRSKLSEILNAPKERVILTSAKTEFGRSHTVGYAKVYDSIETAKLKESKFVLVRNKLAEKEQKKQEKSTKPAPAAKK